MNNDRRTTLFILLGYGVAALLLFSFFKYLSNDVTDPGVEKFFGTLISFDLLFLFGVGGYLVYGWIQNHPQWPYAEAYFKVFHQSKRVYAPRELYIPHVILGERIRAILSTLLPQPPPTHLPEFLPFELFGDRTQQIAELNFIIEARERYDRLKEVVPEVLEVLGNTIAVYAPPKPKFPLATVPLYDAVPVREVVPQIIYRLFSQPALQEAFPEVLHQLNTNRYIYSSDQLSGRAVKARERIDAADFQGSNKELVDTYLANTVFHHIFYLPVQIGLEAKLRFEHMHVIAGTGHGKTQTLQLLIANDLKTDASIVVIDPHGDMIERIAHLETNRRVTIIDPKDAPALNPFAMPAIEGTENERIQTLGSVISLYEYFFGSLLGTELTAKQGVLFRYLAHLMLSIPGANLNTLIAVMDDASPFVPNIEALPTNARNFLLNEFMKGRSFGDTKEQVKYRLYDLIENPAFDRMFNAPTNALDLAHEMDTGGVVLVHADAGFLEQKRASIFGRFFIAKTLQAALQRKDARHPTFLYVDEAWMFFDTKIDQILDQARKYKLGLTLAHQRMGQATPELQSSLHTTAIKLVGNVTAEDARALAPSLHTSPDVLQDLTNDGKGAEWMFYQRGQKAPLKVQTPFFVVENLPALSPHEYRHRRDENRERLSPTSRPAAAAPQQPDKGQEW